jgi:pimeloyl-ACP methyl ester carboxylesterase
MSGSDPATLAQATRAVLRFSSRNWASTITVPSAVLVMTQDRVVPTRRQERLAAAIPGARRFDVDGDHFACADEGTNFIDQLVSACDHVSHASRS